MSYVRFRLFAAAAALLVGPTLVAPSLFGPSLHAAPSDGFILAADGGVIVQDAWARASAGASPNGAAYVTLAGGSQPDSLIGVSTSVAATADIHETINDSGVMKMRPVQAVSIPPGQTVTFVPGGYHIMLMGLKQPLTAGQSFPLTLTFARAAPITVDVQVRGRADGRMGMPMGGHDQMHQQ